MAKGQPDVRSSTSLGQRQRRPSTFVAGSRERWVGGTTVAPSAWREALFLDWRQPPASLVRLWERGGFGIDGFPAVSGAILHDYRARSTRIYPDLALGRAALLTARPGIFPLGARGAGRGAWCGSVMDPARAEPSGQGGAFREEGPTKVAVFSVVNAAGVILDRQGQVVRGNRDPQTGLRTHPLRDLSPASDFCPEQDAMPGTGVSEHTTLTVVVTNQQLSSSSLQQFARQVHTSMARGIYPFHTREMAMSAMPSPPMRWRILG